MDSEFLLNDLIAVERKLERLAEERKKGGGRDKAVIDREFDFFNRFHEALAAGETAAGPDDLTPKKTKCFPAFGFLSRKPLLIVLNLSEGQTAPADELRPPAQPGGGPAGQTGNGYRPAAAGRGQLCSWRNTASTEPSLNRMIRLSYDLLGLQSFFTVGPDEVPRLDGAPRRHRPRSRRRDPHRSAKGLYPRRGGRLQ